MEKNLNEIVQVWKLFSKKKTPNYSWFGVSKNDGRKRFSRFRQKSKLAQRPRFRGTGRPQIRPPRPSEAKNGKNHNLPSWKDDNFFILQGPHLRSRPQSDLWDPSRPRPNIRPPWSFEAATSNTTSEAVRGRNLKSTCKISIEGDLRGHLRPQYSKLLKKVSMSPL